MSVINTNNSATVNPRKPAHLLNPQILSSDEGVKQNNNNAEEIASMFSSRMQQKKSQKEKTLAQSRHLNRRITSVEQVNALSSLLDAKSSVDQKSKDILDMAKSGGLLQNWADDQKKKGEEPAETFLALKLALLESDEKSKPEIEAVLDNLTREDGVAIQTSFNVASTVSKAYPDQAFAQTMRKTIGEGNQNSYDTRSIAELLLKNFGEDDFGRSLDTYSRSILADMNSLLPSTDPKNLSDTFDNLHAANGVRSLVQDCDDLLINFKRETDGSK